jgi:hypothetical protein
MWSVDMHVHGENHVIVQIFWLAGIAHGKHLIGWRRKRKYSFEFLSLYYIFAYGGRNLHYSEWRRCFTYVTTDVEAERAVQGLVDEIYEQIISAVLYAKGLWNFCSVN